jgi:hypothetical protein
MPKQWNITNLSLQVTSMPIISFEQLAFVAYSVSLLEDLSCAAVLVVVLAFFASCRFQCPLIYNCYKGHALQVRSHLLDPYQQHQRGIERFPQIREMMVALESEVQEYGGWGNISCVQVDGKNCRCRV